MWASGVCQRIISLTINYREIVVPWGALHLPGIEAAILQMGFDLSEHTYVPLISWTKVGHSLFGEGE